jgi:P4 family phage/plasmid primase-like protien
MLQKIPIISIPYSNENIVNNLFTLNINIINEQNNYYGDKVNKNDNSKIIKYFCNNTNGIIFFDDEKRNKLFFNSISGQDTKIAKYFYYLFSDYFIFINDKLCYEYDNTKWKITKSLKEIIMYIDNYYIPHLELLIQGLNFKNDSINNFDQFINDDIIKYLEKYINNLKSSIKINTILTYCKTIFTDDNFIDKLDKKPHLLCFENGVFDLDKYIFRESRSDDFITQQIKFSYKTEKTPYYNDVVKFFEDIQPNREDREYLLKFLASCLYGGNNDRLFHIFSGTTTNGKSSLGELIQITLNSKQYGYIQTLDESFLTGTRPDSHCGSPDVVKLLNKRLVFINEPKGNSKINTSFLKILTGKSDELTCRKLHSNDILTFKPEFKIIMSCNDRPLMDSNDAAVWKRSRCLNFPITFVDNPTKDNEKKIDRDLSIKMENWKSDFMILLLEYYKRYKEEGLTPTQNILKFTGEYNADSDYYQSFVNENIEFDINFKEFYKDVKDKFKEWYLKEFEKTPPNQKEIKRNFDRIFNKDNIFKSRIKYVPGLIINNIKLKNNNDTNII